MIVFSNRVFYTQTSFAKTAFLYLQEIGSWQAKKLHTSSRTHLSSYLFSVSIPVSASWNIRERNISWARETVCSSTAGFLTHIVQIKICGLC